MQSTWKRNALAVVAAGLAVGLAACGGHEPKPAAGGPRPAPREVQVVEVGTGAAGGQRSAPATVVARDRATLSARIPASVVALPFREGEHVAAGAVVAQLEDSALKAALAAAEAALSSAQADQRRAESLLAKGAATPREVEQARARAAGAEAAVQGAREAIAYAVMRAPFAGTVAARPADVGDVVNPGAPVIEIEGEGALELRATVDGEQLAAIKVGDVLPAMVDGQAAPLSAKVRSLAGAGDPSTHRFELRAELPATAGLRSGLFARLLMPGAAAVEAVPTVPTRAVFARGGLAGVFVVDGSAARLRWIALGQAAGESVEVRAGLTTGEKVVTDPSGLEDGAPVVVR